MLADLLGDELAGGDLVEDGAGDHDRPSLIGVLRGVVAELKILTSAIHIKVKSSLVMRLSCGNTLKSPPRSRTFWVRATSSVSAGQRSALSRS